MPLHETLYIPLSARRRGRESIEFRVYQAQEIIELQPHIGIAGLRNPQVSVAQ